MSVEIIVPDMGEAGVEATVSRWLKNVGDPVSAGEAVVVLETDKVDLDVAAEADGVLTEIVAAAGQDVSLGDVLGRLSAEAGATPTPPAAPVAQQPAAPAASTSVQPEAASNTPKVTPVARRLADQERIDLAQVPGSGPQGKVTKEDVERFQQRQPAPAASGPAPMVSTPAAPPAPAVDRPRSAEEEVVRLTRRRRTIAQRLVEAQHNAAMLTTFNDVDMTAVMALRKRHKERFQEAHSVSLGLSSFFVKAAIGALKAFPDLNAEIDGDDVIYKHYYDIGIAIGDEEGLVVPVLRDADRLSFAQIEGAIRRFAQQARDGALSLEDLRGGSFTITNGGVFGSLLSTPILNPPQVAILGLHRIEQRPVVVNGEVVVRAMMYMALSYDHRIVDGRGAVQFLARIKALIEDPEALLIDG